MAEIPEGYLKLISSDGQEFLVKQEAANVSKTIKTMMQSTFLEASKKEIRFPELKGKILAKVVDYFEYCAKYADEEDKDKIPEFKIDDGMAVDLALAANYLDC